MHFRHSEARRINNRPGGTPSAYELGEHRTTRYPLVMNSTLGQGRHGGNADDLQWIPLRHQALVEFHPRIDHWGL